MIVIYHANCDDGFGAAWVLRRKFGDKIEGFIPAQYGEAPPLERCRGKPVTVADFSYKRAPMLSLMHAAASVVVLDHHKTAKDELAGIVEEFAREERDRNLDGGAAAMDVRFDMSRSGARLAWSYCFPESEPPELLRRIDDADRWIWDYDDGRFVQAALRSYPQDFEVWDRLMARPIAELAAEGVAIRRYIDGRIQALKAGARDANIGGVVMPVCNAPGFFASDLAGELAAAHESGCAACYFETADQRVYSLRSRGDRDVSEIAKKMGGGGHPGAAGFQVPKP
jgi:oligoribonuclease NrnB/cAMP/cGMP phosphodiesterase (DHH superfamily)